MKRLLLTLLFAVVAAGAAWMIAPSFLGAPRDGGDLEKGALELEGPGREEAAAEGEEPLTAPVIELESAPEPVLEPEEGEPETGVAGTVVTPAGTACRGAKVSLFRCAGGSLLQAAERTLVREPLTADEEGGFRFSGLDGGGGYLLRVEHRDYAPRELADLLVPEGDVLHVPEIRMQGGASIHGDVLDERGEAVAMARVQLLPCGGATPSKQVLTDDQGAYRFLNLPPGLYDLLVSAAGKELQRQHRIDVSAPRAQQRVDFRLAEGRVIAGRVVAPGGDPVEGARVLARPRVGTKFPLVTTATRSDGRFAVEGLGEREYRIEIEAKGYVKSVEPVVSAGTEDLRVLLQPTAGLSGYVRTPEDEPVRSFGLLLWRLGKGDHPNQQLGSMIEVTSKDGSFQIDDVAPGSYKIQAFANGFGPTWSDAFRVGSIYMHGLVIRMQPGAVLTGRVLDARGEPAANARVRLFENIYFESPVADLIHGRFSERAQPVRTDAEGRFRFEQLESDTFQLRVSFAEHALLVRRDVAVEQGQTTDLGDVRLSRGGEIRATLHRAGAPAPGATLSVMAEDGSVIEKVANGEGECVVENLPAGQYVLSALPAAGTDQRSVFEVLIAAQRNQEVVSIEEGHVLAVQVAVPGS